MSIGLLVLIKKYEPHNISYAPVKTLRNKLKRYYHKSYYYKVKEKISLSVRTHNIYAYVLIFSNNSNIYMIHDKYSEGKLEI